MPRKNDIPAPKNTKKDIMAYYAAVGTLNGDIHTAIGDMYLMIQLGVSVCPCSIREHGNVRLTAKRTYLLLGLVFHG
jgi:hypothetical protein